METRSPTAVGVVRPPGLGGPIDTTVRYPPLHVGTSDLNFAASKAHIVIEFFFFSILISGSGLTPRFEVHGQTAVRAKMLSQLAIPPVSYAFYAFCFLFFLVFEPSLRFFFSSSLDKPWVKPLVSPCSPRNTCLRFISRAESSFSFSYC